MEFVLWTALFFPLAGFFSILSFGSYLPRRVVECTGPLTVLASFFCFSFLLYQYSLGYSLPETTLFTWLPIKGFGADFSLHLDHLALLMTLIITGVGFLIHAYSVGYMDHDEDYCRYFAVMNFFIFSMLVLVLAANLLVFFIGWEGVGVASYLLIGFWYKRPSAQKAAKKAFVVNRIGDLGLLLGIFLTYFLFGTSNMQEVCARVGHEFAIGAPVITTLSFLYFWGACGKSAQIPLHTWLPDAMEGPTPVSALIHAATMVTAGIYLVVRMHPVFQAAPLAMQFMAFTGAITALFAALCATSQTDIKRVLAYSTLSQLGLMFLACGMGAYFAAMFHLTTHAFVKALLFLSAGNVIHMLHGTTEMSKMGGLAKLLPKTNALFLIGVLSMAGIPPLAIFFSKDLILEDISGSKISYIAGLCVSLLTAFYLTRAYTLAFKGPSTLEKSKQSILKDAPVIMILPLIVLGLLSIGGGLLGFAFNKAPPLLQFLAKDSQNFTETAIEAGFHFTLETWLSIGVATLGVAIGAIVYGRYAKRLGATFTLFYQSFYINELYHHLLVRPLKAVSQLINTFFEPKLFDSSLQTMGNASLKTAKSLQAVQTGQIRSAISWIVAGAGLLIIYLVIESL